MKYNYAKINSKLTTIQVQCMLQYTLQAGNPQRFACK